VDQCEAETRAATALPGREERLEDPYERLIVDAAPAVLDADANMTAWLQRSVRQRTVGLDVLRRHGDAQRTAGLHRVDRVGTQVHDDLAQLRRVAHHYQRRIRHLGVQRHASGERAAHEAQRFRHAAAQVSRRALATLVAGVSENLIGNIAAAHRGGEDELRTLLGRRIQRCVAAQRLGKRNDGADQIVEVVRDAARKASDGFHFRGLLQLLLQIRSVSIGTLARVDVPPRLVADVRLQAQDLRGCLFQRRP
jgi:hypothetical protein